MDPGLRVIVIDRLMAFVVQRFEKWPRFEKYDVSMHMKDLFSGFSVMTIRYVLTILHCMLLNSYAED